VLNLLNDLIKDMYNDVNHHADATMGKLLPYEEYAQQVGKYQANIKLIAKLEALRDRITNE